MKKWLLITVLLPSLVLVGATACNPFGGDESAGQQLVEVIRGDVTVTVNGIGNIAISEERKLTFGSDGKVAIITIEDGDEIKKGDMLAELDTDALELAVAKARVVVSEKQVAITEADVGLTEQQIAVIQAEVALSEKKVAVTQAEVDLETAEYNLYEAKDDYIWRDIDAAQADVDEAQRYLDDALRNLRYSSPGIGEEFAQKVVIRAENRLETAKDILDAMVAGTDPQDIVIRNMEVELAKQSLALAGQSEELAQYTLEQEQQSLKLAEQSLALARESLRQAKQTLKHEQKVLSEATLIAPFDGIAATVYIDEGDSVSATTDIIHLVDLSSLQVKVEVDEIDIPGVKLGQSAIVALDALPAVKLEGEVTLIPPVSKEKAGLVLYDVEIGFEVPQGLALRGGMSATADIVIDEKSNVLLVPNQAVSQDEQGNPIVIVVAGEQREERKVVTGISDGSQTEILRGLDEGEMIVIEVGK